nr:hypothetical protein [Tanacetum cinerariifolium]
KENVIADALSRKEREPPLRVRSLTNDVTRLQALDDRKKVVITEAAIRDVLRLDDAEGVGCLPNEEIFAELAQSICQHEEVGKGFLGMETPLFEGMLVARVIEEEGDAEEQVQDNVDDAAAQRADIDVQGDDVYEPSIPSPTPPPQQSQDLPSTSQEALDACAALTRRVEHLEYDKVAQALEITKLKRMVKKLEKGNMAKVLKLRRRRKRVVIRDPKEESTTITAADTKSKDNGNRIMVEESKPMKKKQQVEMDEEYARKLHEELNKDIDWDVAIEHVKKKAKEDPFVQRYQVMKKRPQTEAQAQKNMIMYLKNVAKENRAIQSINKTPAQKAAKRRKLNEEVEYLKKHLEIVPNKDDNVYTEATPLARKVPIVDYEIIHLNNKPHYKIIRADGTRQLRYPLSRFTLDQILNAVRLRVEEQSEMSLELLRYGLCLNE